MRRLAAVEGPSLLTMFFLIAQVHLKINGQDTGLMMRLGAEGEAYFVEQVDDLNEDDSEADGCSMYGQSERGSVQIETPVHQ